MKTFHFCSLAIVVLFSACTTVQTLDQPDAGFFQVIYDTTSSVDDAFVADLGYAVYVSFEEKRLLMDSGDQPEVLANNLNAAGISVDDLDLAFITHSHSDHAGGLSYLQSTRPSLQIYVPQDGRFNAEGLIEIEDFLQVTPNLFIIRTHDDGGSQNIQDELSLLITTEQGPYLFTACTHTGLFAILDKAERIAGQEIFRYIGGSGLMFGPDTKAVETADKLMASGVSQVSPAHCNAVGRVEAIFESKFETNYIPSHLGEEVPLEPASN